MIKSAHSSLSILRGLMVATLVVPFIGFVLGSWRTYRVEHKSADSKIEQTLDILQEHSLKVFESAELTIAYVSQLIAHSSDDDIRRSEATLHRQFQGIAKTLSAIGAIWVFNANGEA